MGRKFVVLNDERERERERQRDALVKHYNPIERTLPMPAKMGAFLCTKK